jgi:DNA-binding NtrC family response regulator
MNRSPSGDARSIADARTLTSPLARLESQVAAATALTVIWHPDMSRLGARTLLPSTPTACPINRFTPLFTTTPGTAPLPLAHPSISRTPVTLNVDVDGSVTIASAPSRMTVEVDGRGLPAAGTRLDSVAVDDGVVLQLGGHVALCVHRVRTLPDTPIDGLVGGSSAMVRVRSQVRQVAATDLPVLVLGESGTGKEAVAQAVHALSARSKGPMVCVNMAAMGESLAAADLFGTVRGAYTGAQSARRGLLAQADGGTLFLDEIGDAAATIQPMLLRVLETGRYRPLGASQEDRTDVRLVAATDRDLSAETGFNQPLRRRLEAIVIRTPALRQRREDIGVLLALLASGRARGDLSAVPTELASTFCLYDWPGNVRQLGHAVNRLLLGWRSGSWPTPDELVGESKGRAMQVRTTMQTVDAPRDAGDGAVGSGGRATYRRPAEVGGAEVVAALDAAGWTVRRAAELLGVSRPSLYALLQRCPQIRQAHQISRADIEAEIARCGSSDLDALARGLRTPREALRRHMLKLGFAG